MPATSYELGPNETVFGGGMGAVTMRFGRSRLAQSNSETKESPAPDTASPTADTASPEKAAAPGAEPKPKP